MRLATAMRKPMRRRPTRSADARQPDARSGATGGGNPGTVHLQLHRERAGAGRLDHEGMVARAAPEGAGAEVTGARNRVGHERIGTRKVTGVLRVERAEGIPEVPARILQPGILPAEAGEVVEIVGELPLRHQRGEGDAGCRLNVLVAGVAGTDQAPGERGADRVAPEL